ncbi:hypothetical protein BJ875DRAFT_507115 [Amylocarpus encephaloides]|uniref:Uncharacterized protein n=1 Tax=Amylocarpus encephaloides TaxID=45428 RepID=A0A9P7YCL2_9HELO|nr:hypothetical protein BJ875DRAFT_507115 [Amylocarpus encephaloides]
MHLSAPEVRRRQNAESPGGNRNEASPPSAITSGSSTLHIPLSATGTSSTSSATATATAIARSTSKDSDKRDSPSFVPIIIGAIAGVLGLLLVFVTIRKFRVKHKNPKYLPTPFLKNAWKKWEPKSSTPHRRLPDANGHLEPVSTRSSRSTPAPTSLDAAARGATSTNATSTNTTAAGVDRNTSVRSVMTLPAYNPTAHQSEQVLGREGERGGIDVVIEFPETVDDEERLREQEMEALYQVRLARRRENEEREDRRRQRREARERGDYVALREIQARARASSSTSATRTVEELRAEHERVKKERQRAVSSVSYGDLGVARHDGTRLRANSVESEREGLLGDAASIAASSNYHRRDRSQGSVISLDTVNMDFPSPGQTRSRTNSRAESPLRQIGRPSQDGSFNNEGRAGSSPEMVEHENLPPNSPPGYENIPLDAPSTEAGHEAPPDYASPVLARGEHRPIFESADSGGSGHTRRTSAHVGELASDRRASRSSGRISPSRPDSERSSSRGVGGLPQLPSLRLAALPSIQVDPGSPTQGRSEDGHQHP